MRFPTWRLYDRLLRRPGNVFISFGMSIREMNMDCIGNNVIHDEEKNEFYIKLGKEKAVLQYQFIGKENEIVDLYHTGVPESQRGKGIAAHLVQAAFSFVVAKNLKVRPTCSYVEHYIDKNKPSEIIPRLYQQ